ncbi:MAG TPA: FtsQ-type POTRA domain-containing protein [Longimicrobiales bacterium]
MTRTRWLLLACGACVVTSVAAGAPTLLRRMDAFKVQRVEIRGTRYLAPYDALVQTGITRTSNVFDEFQPWRDRLLRHPMVLAADVERELPNTIKVSITEAEPIALARTPALRPVDARARALPIDPSAIDLDLPLLTRAARPDANGYFSDAQTRDAIAVLNMLRHRDARLYSWISEVAPAGNQGLLLHLRQPAGAKALVADDPRALRLRELEVTLSDLSARGELSQLKRIDARFRDQIVVTLDRANRN